MGSKTYKVVYDAKVIDEEFGKISPFNLKRDVKNISNGELERISNSIADELKAGPNGKVYIIRYISKKHKLINYSKIRCEDKIRNFGKSGGYRCIVLVDGINNYGYILHIYRHGHGESNNINKSDENKLKNVVEAYAEALNF